MANLLYLLTTGSLLLGAFLLITKPRNTNRVASRWMAVFLYFLTLIFMDDSLAILKLGQEVLARTDFLGVFILAVGPTYYLSVYAYTNPQPIRLRASLLHFLPFLFFFLLTCLLALLSEAQQMVLAQEMKKVNQALISAVIIFLNVSQIIAYCFFSLSLINRHQQTVRIFASSPDAVDLSWLKYSLYGVFFMAIIWSITLVFPWLDPYMTVFYLASVYYIAYYALNQREIFPFSEAEKTAIAEVLEEAKTSQPVREETKKALLPPDELHDAKERLLASMLTDKCYLDNELTLPKLAEVTQLSIHKLSYLLNNDFGQNFYQFVNGYRIEEAKRLLLDAKKSHLSIEGIAYEAGFNSKSVFNTTFKKTTGLSPSEFRTSMLAVV